MILPSAQPVWDYVQLLQYILFPWRWLGPIAVCIAMLVASIGPMIASVEKHRALVIRGNGGVDHPQSAASAAARIRRRRSNLLDAATNRIPRPRSVQPRGIPAEVDADAPPPSSRDPPKLCQAMGDSPDSPYSGLMVGSDHASNAGDGPDLACLLSLSGASSCDTTCQIVAFGQFWAHSIRRASRRASYQRHLDPNRGLMDRGSTQLVCLADFRVHGYADPSPERDSI